MKVTNDPRSKTRLRAQIRTQVLPNGTQLQRQNLSFYITISAIECASLNWIQLHRVNSVPDRPSVKTEANRYVPNRRKFRDYRADI